MQNVSSVLKRFVIHNGHYFPEAIKLKVVNFRAAFSTQRKLFDEQKLVQGFLVMRWRFYQQNMDRQQHF